MSEHKQSSRFRPDIEGLRGLAVLLVVAFHCGATMLPGGFVGVDVFFVLSGYLITGLLVAEVERTSTVSLVQFYARRVRRLLPAAAVVFLATIAIGLLVLAPHEMVVASRAARATALYASNMFFASNAADYFGPNVDTNPLLHTWSLAVEEQFYLFWPVLILLGLRGRKSPRVLAALLAVVTVVSFSVCVWATAHYGTLAFYSLPTRAWEFGVGGLAALLPRMTHRALAAALAWGGLAAIAASGALLTGDANFPGWLALLPTLGTAAVLIAYVDAPSHRAGRLLNTAPLQWLGKLSYSWYLWHWPFLVFAAALFPAIPVIAKCAAAGLALAAAAITHRLIENPVRFHRQLVARPRLSLGMGAAMSLAMVAVAMVSMRIAVRTERSPEMRAISAAAEDIGRMPRERCVTLGDSGEVKTCDFGDAQSPTTVVLFGDSHAIQWFNPLEQLAESHHWKLTTIVKSGCPAADVVLPRTSQGFAENCASWREQAIRRIAEINPSIVLVGSATTYLRRSTRPGTTFDLPLDEWSRGMHRTLASLSQRGVRVLAIRDTPRPSFDVPSCLARVKHQGWFDPSSCNIQKSTAVDPAIYDVEQASARGLHGVDFVDFTNDVCPGDICAPVHGKVITFRDDNHLTGTFAQTLLPRWESRLLPILNAN